MSTMKYIVYREGDDYVSQCLNIDVASCGKTFDEAVTNLVEAVELFLQDTTEPVSFLPITDISIGEKKVNA